MTTLLLDTHVVLWALAAPSRLGDARADFEDVDTERLCSAVVPWEVAIKADLGRIDLGGRSVDRWYADALDQLALTRLPISDVDVLGVAALPPIHRDPFDRLLVAQAARLGVPLVTGDETLRGYGIDVRLLS